MEEYNGEYLLMDRLLKFISVKMAWNKRELTLNDVKYAIEKSVTEQAEQYGNNTHFADTKVQSDEWHLGRIIYFINHPEEIKDIVIDNLVNGNSIFTMYICPIPIIDDGNHRFMAAAYLGLEKVHCRYGGREDLQLYLKGETDVCPFE